MPALHKVLKLKAGARATAQARLLQSGVKNENSKLRREKSSASSAAPTPSSPSSKASSARPSFVNSFVSSFSGSSASSTASSDAGKVPVGLRHTKDPGLTASQAFSRAVATPSVHRSLRQSSQPLSIDTKDPEWAKGFPIKVIFVSSLRGKTEEVLGKAVIKGANSPRERASPKKHPNQGNAMSSARNEVWKERRWRALGAEVREDPAKRESLAELDKNSVDTLPNRVEQSEDVARSSGFSSEAEPADSTVACTMFQRLAIIEKAETIGETIGKVNGCDSGKNAGGLQPLRTRLVPVNICKESAIVPLSGGFFKRALHDASLAGEGSPLDRPAESATTAQSQQSPDDAKLLRLLSGACNLPHPDKEKTGGEDAFFICPDEHVVGVADGVGGWADLGIDAGEYARELMSQSMIAVQQEPPGAIDPARVMEKAHSMTKCKGSSTACILALTDTGLEAANLGDSGFVIVRNSRTIFRSPVQQHQFNIPFQLEHGGSDPPSAAQVFSFEVSLGDIIVAGTDGLFDNLYGSELTTVVVQSVRGGLEPQKTAQKIAALARSRAQDKNRQTPFSTAAQDAGFRFYGGKMDDITVIVSYITSTTSATSRL